MQLPPEQRPALERKFRTRDRLRLAAGIILALLIVAIIVVGISDSIGFS